MTALHKQEETLQPTLQPTAEKPAPRVPLKLEVEFRKSYARQPDGGSLKNISITGAFLEHENPELHPRDKLNLVFKVSGRTRTIMAQVVWCSNGGSGIRFLPDNNRDVQIIDDLIYFVQNRRESRRTVLDNIFKRVA